MQKANIWYPFADADNGISMPMLFAGVYVLVIGQCEGTIYMKTAIWILDWHPNKHMYRDAPRIVPSANFENYDNAYYM